MDIQNQNSGQEHQPTKILSSSEKNIVSKRPVIPSFFFLAIIFFFFNFCVFKCGGQEIGTVTGINFVTGTNLASKDLVTGRETQGQEIPANVWAVIAFAAAIIGFGVSISKNNKEDVLCAVAGIVGSISLIILQIYIKNTIDQKTNGGVNVDFLFPYWGALLALGTASILSYQRKQKTAAILLSNPPPPTNKTPNMNNKFQSQTIPVSTSPIVQFDIGMWINKNVKVASEWCFKNKKILVTIIGAILVLYATYYFLLKNDPVRDAKNIALAFCDCSTKYNDAMIKIDEAFLESFNTYSFKSRQEARDKLQELRNSLDAENSNCIRNAQQVYNDLRSRYISEQEVLSKFDFAYGSYSGSCNPSNQSKLTSLNSEVENKITSIKIPEPDIEKIKANLIGQKIPGWNFQYLSEIKTAVISKTTRSPERIEYYVNLHMVGYTKTDENYNDAQVIVTYIAGYDNWYFNNVKEIYITFENQIPSDNWVTITPLQNCTFQVSDEQKLSWKTYSFSPEIKTGPDARDITLPKSYFYLLKSREGHPITVKFTYRPIIEISYDENRQYKKKQNSIYFTLLTSSFNYF